MGFLKRLVNKYSKPKESNIFCGAPGNFAYFRVNGCVSFCCENFEDILGIYPEHTIKNIFEGEIRESLINKFNNGEKLRGCYKCYQAIETGNPENALFQNYRTLSNNSKFPVAIEFELSNHCNLKCQMCSAEYSDKFQQDPDLTQNSIYENDFIDQITPYIPFLKFAGFKGGEPFLINLYFDLWEKMIKINNDIVFQITTNGTVLNSRIKDVLSKGNFNICVSLDSLNQENFEIIRTNANFRTFLSNLDFFMDYCKSQNTTFNSCTCIMRDNYLDIPEIFEFADKRNFELRIIFVETPTHLSLKYMDKKELEAIIEHYNSIKLSENSASGRKNIITYKSMIKQIKTWHQENINCDNLEPKHSTEAEFERKKQLFFNKINESVSVYYNIPASDKKNEITMNQIAKFTGVYKKALFYLSKDQIIDAFLNADNSLIINFLGMTESQIIDFLKKNFVQDTRIK